MKNANKILRYSTKEMYDFIDITTEVENFVTETKIKNGLVNVQIFHTSAALIINEYEPLLLEDIKRNLEECSSCNLDYRHDDFSVRTVNLCENECDNGHSHCKAIHLASNAVFNLIDGKLQRGQYQNIILLELDRPRPRQVQIMIIGE